MPTTSDVSPRRAKGANQNTSGKQRLPNKKAIPRSTCLFHCRSTTDPNLSGSLRSEDPEFHQYFATGTYLHISYNDLTETKSFESSGLPQPEVGMPVLPQPEVGASGTVFSQPGVGVPVLSQPEVRAPVLPQQEVGLSILSQPEVGVSGAVLPQPEVGLPFLPQPEVRSSVLSPVPTEGSMVAFNGSSIMNPILFKPRQKKRRRICQVSTSKSFHNSSNTIRQITPQISFELGMLSMLNHPSGSDVDGGQMDSSSCSMENHASDKSVLGSSQQSSSGVSYQRNTRGSLSRHVDFRRKYRRYVDLYSRRMPSVMEGTTMKVIAFI